MLNLVISEFERLWARTKTRVILLSVPTLSLVTALFFRWMNQDLDPESRFFVAAANFAYMNFNHHLVLTLSLLLPLLAVDVFTGEWESGGLRTVLLRPYYRRQIFAAQLLALWGFVLVVVGGIYLTIPLAICSCRSKLWPCMALTSRWPARRSSCIL